MASTGEAGRYGRLPALDGLRAFAFATVFISHLPNSPLEGGGIGVLAFFVLSGYLITSLLLRERDTTGRIDLGRFYLRRAARLLPAATLVILVSLIAVPLLTGIGSVASAGTVNGALPSLFYFANWVWFVDGTSSYLSLGALGHYWSLSVEEQFYLVWPVVLIAVLSRWSERALAVVLAVVVVAAPIYRVVVIDGVDTDRYFFGTHSVADQLAWGALLAVAVRLWPRMVTVLCRWLLVPAFGLLALALFYHPAGHNTVGVALVAAASVVLVGRLTTADTATGRVLACGPLPYLGRISYGLYLWHILGITAAQTFLGAGVASAVVAAGLTLVVAAASFRWFEQPIMRAVARQAAGNEQVSQNQTLEPTTGITSPLGRTVSRPNALLDVVGNDQPPVLDAIAAGR